MSIKKHISLCILLLGFISPTHVHAQNADTTLSLSTFLQLLEQYHPIAKQANLLADQADAQKREVKGAFDPKLEIEQSRKRFDDKEYFEQGTAQLKIPLWMIDLKTGVEYGRGDFIDPQRETPTDGLFFLGMEVPLGRDLWIDKRRTMLRQSRLFTEMANAERQKELAKLATSAVKAFANWTASYSRYTQYVTFEQNAVDRLNFVIRQLANGEYSAVDSLEADLELQQRRVQLQEALMDLEQSRLNLSTFLWSDQGTPLALPKTTKPKLSIDSFTPVVATLLKNIEDMNVDAHPEIRKNELKLRSLKYDLTLAKSRLLPDIKLSFTPILQNREDALESLRFEPEQASKAALNVTMPLLLRKERGKFAQSQIKVKTQKYELDQVSLEINRAFDIQWVRLQQMLQMTASQAKVVMAAERLAGAERRKFQLGESSLFLINKREAYVVESALKLISLEEKILGGYAELLNAQGKLWQEQRLNFPLTNGL